MVSTMVKNILTDKIKTYRQALTQAKYSSHAVQLNEALNDLETTLPIERTTNATAILRAVTI